MMLLDQSQSWKSECYYFFFMVGGKFRLPLMRIHLQILIQKFKIHPLRTMTGLTFTVHEICLCSLCLLLCRYQTPSCCWHTNHLSLRTQPGSRLAGDLPHKTSSNFPVLIVPVRWYPNFTSSSLTIFINYKYYH